MAKLPTRKLVLAVALLQGALLFSSSAFAQSPSMRASSLVRDAMEAYSNLDLENAKALLDQAAALGPQLDKPTLARVYVSYGLLWTGGFSDNAQGQKNFVIAQCLDASIQVDPLLSSPDSDMIFNLSRSQSTPDKCPAVLGAAGIAGSVPPTTGPAVGPVGVRSGLPACGSHMELKEQKRKFELPFFLEVDPTMAASVKKLKAFYAFDSAANYNELALTQKGSGYGVLLDCDRGQVRIYDPSTVAYYIEGYDATGKAVCSHGSKTMPLEVLMLPDAMPLPGIAGMLPKECAPCPPWDETCGKTSGLPALGEPCQPDVGCDQDMTCGDLGICELTEGSQGSQGGPSKFYVSLMGGVGFGYQKQEIEVRQFNELSQELETVSTTPAGFAFGGIPVRLHVGLYLTENFSLELAGRFDVMVASQNSLKSCLEGVTEAGVEPDADGVYDPADVWQSYCEPTDGQGDLDVNGDGDVTADDLGKLLFADGDINPGDGNLIEDTEYRIGWATLLRARYRVVHKGGLGVSLFLGAGYGVYKYRVPGESDPYFPMAKGLVIEVGPELAYYFNDHFGIVVGLPIDIVFPDGFALNFDPTLGLSVGF